MSTLATNALTLMDVAKRSDPDGKVAKIVEMLAQTNEVITDMLWMEGNLPTGHRTSVRTGLPTAAWRLLNQGTQPSKSTTAQVDEACAILEAWSEVDKAICDLNGNTNAYRLSEAMAFIEAMNQEFAGTLFYGNSSVSPEEFTGLAARYSSLSAANGANILNAGGGGSDNSSIWLVAWGSQSIFGIYPKGSKAGLVHEDLGLQTVQTSTSFAGTRLRAYQDRWVWNCGVALRDWRYVVRIANIDISNLTTESSAADLSKLMIKAYHRLPSMGLGKPVYYMNRSVREMLDIQRRDFTALGGGIKEENVDGKPVMSFRGIPVRLVDQLHELETVVS